MPRLIAFNGEDSFAHAAAVAAATASTAATAAAAAATAATAAGAGAGGAGGAGADNESKGKSEGLCALFDSALTIPTARSCW